VWVTPRGVLLFGFLVALLTSVVLVLCWVTPQHPDADVRVAWGMLFLFVPFLGAPAALCAAGLGLARQHPLLPWINGQVRIVLAIGFVVVLADLLALVTFTMLPDLGASVFTLYATVGLMSFWVTGFIGLRILAYLLRWQWGERPDGWRDAE
jgi:hypothetical protein